MKEGLTKLNPENTPESHIKSSKISFGGTWSNSTWRIIWLSNPKRAGCGCYSHIFGVSEQEITQFTIHEKATISKFNMAAMLNIIFF